MRCCIQTCFNDDTKKTNKSHGITFHKLPRDPDHSAAWLAALASLGCRTNKCLVVCSEHFLPEDFDDTRHNQRRVKSGAVPTIAAMDPSSLEELKVCRVCLAVDVKMYNMKDSGLIDMFQSVTGITGVEKKASLLQRVCWECVARLTAASAFKEKALLSNSLLKNQVHIRESDIALLKKNHSSLKSPLCVKTAVTSFDIEFEHIESGDKETNISRTSETDIQERKHEMSVVFEQERENEFGQYESWIDVPVKTEIECDPIADNTVQEDSEDMTTNTEVQMNNDENIRDDAPNKIPHMTDAGNVTVDKEKNIKPDVSAKIVDETWIREHVLSTMMSGSKSEPTVSGEAGAPAKKRRTYLINERIKEKIVMMKSEGCTVAAISNETGLSVSSITCWWRRYRKSNYAFQRYPPPRNRSGQIQHFCHITSEPGKEMEDCPKIVRERLCEAGLEHILMKKPGTVTTATKVSPRKALHEDLKRRIVALKQEGMSNSRIAYLLNTARNTVQKWWTRWCNEGSMEDHKQPGRRRKTTPEEDQLLIERVAQEQTVHTPSLAKEFGISLKCLTNRLKEAGFKNKTREAYVPMKAGRSHKVDEEVKQQIISMKLNGISVTDIANQFRVPRTTIYQWWQRWCKENNVKVTNNKNTSTAAEQYQALAEHALGEMIVETPSIVSSQKSLWQKPADL